MPQQHSKDIRVKPGIELRGVKKIMNEGVKKHPLFEAKAEFGWFSRMK